MLREEEMQAKKRELGVITVQSEADALKFSMHITQESKQGG